jgi:hypothetical protein
MEAFDLVIVGAGEPTWADKLFEMERSYLSNA